MIDDVDRFLRARPPTRPNPPAPVPADGDPAAWGSWAASWRVGDPPGAAERRRWVLNIIGRSAANDEAWEALVAAGAVPEAWRDGAMRFRFPGRVLAGGWRAFPPSAAMPALLASPESAIAAEPLALAAFERLSAWSPARPDPARLPTPPRTSCEVVYRLGQPLAVSVPRASSFVSLPLAVSVPRAPSLVGPPPRPATPSRRAGALSLREPGPSRAEYQWEPLFDYDLLGATPSEGVVGWDVRGGECGGLLSCAGMVNALLLSTPPKPWFWQVLAMLFPNLPPSIPRRDVSMLVEGLLTLREMREAGACIPEDHRLGPAVVGRPAREVPDVFTPLLDLYAAGYYWPAEHEGFPSLYVLEPGP